MPRGAQYDYAQLEGLWTGAGGPARLAPLMAAIAMAESGGNPRAYNPSGASGLWQILGAPSGVGGNPFDPQVNARMAVAKWKQQGLGAWVTYTSGAYKRFLQKGVPPSGQSAQIPYRNPLRGLRGLQAERVDMGVDYSATSGPIYALGPGVITESDTSWAGGYGTGPGTFIEERLTAGPLKGHYVYASEHIIPRVRVGQRVTAATQIGDVTGGIETGFGAGPSEPGTTAAMAAGQTPASGDPGAHPTAFGAAYSKLLGDLGAPGGTIAGQAVGQLPPWLARIIPQFGVAGGSGVGGGGLFPSPLGSIGSAIQGISDWLNGLSTAVDWLLQPSNWVRIVAGLGGGVLVLGGMFTLTHAGESMLGPVSRPAALPIGIGMIGGGGVLLFVAFHNLPGSPANIGELLGSLRDEAQSASAGQAVAA
jgi:hypothetical protein